MITSPFKSCLKNRWFPVSIIWAMSGRSSLLLVIRRSLIGTSIIDNCDEQAIMPIALPQLEKYVNLYRHSISVNLSGLRSSWATLIQLYTRRKWVAYKWYLGMCEPRKFWTLLQNFMILEKGDLLQRISFHGMIN